MKPTGTGITCARPNSFGDTTLTAVFRDICMADMPAIGGMIRSSLWPETSRMDDSVSLPFIDIVLTDYLSRSNYGKAAIVDGEFAGFIMGRAGDAPMIISDEEKERRIDADVCSVSGTVKGRYILRYNSRIEAADEDMLASAGHDFDGEIVGFIVKDKFGGKGIGKVLVEGFVKYALSRGCASLYIMTDDYCNYGFYDHLGCEKIAVRKVRTMIRKDRFYLYCMDIY